MSKFDTKNKNFEKLTEREKIRVVETLNFMPNVNSVLEAGCGDGRLLNNLIDEYEILCGIDINPESLKHVKTPKIQGNINKLPFEDKSYDLVLFCEVLEHLPYSIYKKSIKEIERVAKEYIIISVPNNENINISKVKCPSCNNEFHPWGHLRSFNESDLNHIFMDFEPVQYKIILEQKTLPTFITKLFRFLKISKHDFPRNVLCKNCGYIKKDKSEDKNQNKVKFSTKNPIYKSLMQILPFKKRNGWILMLYRSRDYYNEKK